MAIVRSERSKRVEMLVAGALLLLTSRADAVIDCSSGITFSGAGTTTLTDDYDSGSGTAPCITLTAGRNLNLNGHTITRTHGNYASPAAIACTATGSEVYGGRLEGTFLRGVQDCEFVHDMEIGQAWVPSFWNNVGPDTGIYNSSLVAKASEIYNNRIDTDGSGYGINSYLLNDSSFVRDNYIHALTCMQILGTNGGSGPIVEHNVCNPRGVTVYSYDKVRIRKNLSFDRGNTSYPCFASGTAGAVLTDNICDCPASCLMAPPFVLPLY